MATPHAADNASATYSCRRTDSDSVGADAAIFGQWGAVPAVGLVWLQITTWLLG
ncbi:hypothetical protein Micbo1qcDRAFT_165710 [Microdochium bolleyi]|uniref:Uncharacterized protein n=1 Tax=Microdochium bolleyi TaxID=196109 RepID=A0A136IX27_9PEZI|nr:hypothetical protein Micbo1qcDRAFT_165710 [Microdochium bolleyi]